jgi:hypothetical protein
MGLKRGATGNTLGNLKGKILGTKKKRKERKEIEAF